MSDALLERIAVALEKIAAVQTVPAAIPEQPAAPEPADNVVSITKKRGRPKKEDAVEAAPAETPAAVATSPVQRSFLDDDDAPAAAPEVTAKTPEEKYKDIRAGLIQLQNAKGPDVALKLLKDVGGVEMLRDLKPDVYDKVLAALDAASKK